MRNAVTKELTELVQLENNAFESDRISRRSFRHALNSTNSTILVAVYQDEGDDHKEGALVRADKIVGYALLHLHQGTRLARLYSIAVSEAVRGKGVAKMLLESCENEALSKNKIMLRLEVNEHNLPAIRLYEKLGYRKFGHYDAYYEDLSNALRMQKRIRHLSQERVSVALPWIQQGTPFTCGPASLQMGLTALIPSYKADPDDELQIWREATTIFMTSGHGGCHPMGLALAAKKRGAIAEVWLNEKAPLFVDGVRDALKKDIVTRVHTMFVKECIEADITVRYFTMTLESLLAAFDSGYLPIILISTYRMDGKKAPHWVVLSGYDEQCIYVHDPDPSSDAHSSVDCQYVPIAREDFEKMSRFGQSRLQTAVLLSAK
ncbi:GNAT family N-acetyltransferase/peptidase C39 family protein [Marinomonas algicola]|uniref:GNAT family N-acetyltransferase/peptidase C39 family protein n=1 Tax=Marinomonas algicola TaxID=2773454 RepID=UPI001EFF0E56|nr:GNAT family N-acetyltransferase/peptidase C39 family protein [Marinomonas algicola]